MIVAVNPDAMMYFIGATASNKLKVIIVGITAAINVPTY